MISSIQDIQQRVLAGWNSWELEGNVSVKQYEDLLIFNYTPAAQYVGEWNYFERVSRGLIINAITGEIVSRPFDKFFNWFEGGRKASGHIVTVTEKCDGSLGILYRHNGQYKIATRGSFEGEQAVWATSFLQDNYDLTGLPDELTLLFEIIYPDNRIVVDYGTREDLVLLAARNRFTGEYLPFFPDVYELGQQFGFSLPQVYSFENISAILEVAGGLDANHEGFVVEFSDGSRWKIKGDRYLELHRALSSLTFKNILAACANNTLDDLFAIIPDEFLEEAKITTSKIQREVSSIHSQVIAAYLQSPYEASRKEFALWGQENHKDLAPYLFAMLDGKDVVDLIYKHHDFSSLEKED